MVICGASDGSSWADGNKGGSCTERRRAFHRVTCLDMLVGSQFIVSERVNHRKEEKVFCEKAQNADVPFSDWLCGVQSRSYGNRVMFISLAFTTP